MIIYFTVLYQKQKYSFLFSQKNIIYVSQKRITSIKENISAQYLYVHGIHARRIDTHTRLHSCVRSQLIMMYILIFAYWCREMKLIVITYSL